MAVIATGFFDGVHLGHRLVIDTLLSEARARGEESVVVTFWPHPRVTLGKDADSLRLLTSREVKEEMLHGLGVDRLHTIEFSREFASLSALDYIRMLRDGYGCTALVLGYDTRFGSEQLSPQAIAGLARAEGLDSVVVPPVCAPDSTVPISSTLIRTALEEGDTPLAASYLGRPYGIEGTVVSGNRLGRTLGFPTANLAPCEPMLLIPCSGVYHSTVVVGGVEYDAMTNVGTRPTVSAGPAVSAGRTGVGSGPAAELHPAGALTVESHIFDFDADIYGQRISVRFLERIRAERRFPSLDALRTQLCADASRIRG